VTSLRTYRRLNSSSLEREVCNDHYRQLQAAEVLSMLSTMNEKSSFIKVLLVITKQLLIKLKLYLSFKNTNMVLNKKHSELEII
jgi:hypothetical protein